jgi:transcriptional regulator with XRE-family HTH domain
MTLAGTYHHGQTLREARLARSMTQAELAERWPGAPVTARYVQRVEAGEKHLTDQQLLRALAELLGIPLWRFGLSEYNPFDPRRLPGHGERMYNETLDVVELLVDRTWYMRGTAPMPETEKNTRRLLDLFASLVVSLPPTAQLERRFLRLYAQVQRLHAVMRVERREYGAALLAFHEMLRIAEQLGEPSTIALALMGIGTELARAGRQQEAVDRLEQARDVSFNASKQVAALVNAYLARAYASNHEATASSGPSTRRRRLPPT